MKYILLFLSMAFFAIDNCFAQDTIKHFINYFEEVKCEPWEGYYYRVAYKDGNWWRVKDYYANEGTLYRDGVYKNYSNDSFYNKQGMFLSFHANKIIAQKVRYINGLKEGIQKSYDTTGRLIDSSFFTKEIPSKVGCRWDSEGKMTFKGVYEETGSGAGEEWEYYPDGTLASNGKLTVGYKKEGVWKFFHTNGQVSSIENYAQDSIISLECFNEKGIKSKQCFVESMPEPPYDVNSFLGRNMRYPDEARENNIEGRVNVSFIVDKLGRIHNIRSTSRRVGGGCDEEAIRVISIMPNWKPALRHNKPVDVKYTLPVSFRLG